MQEKEQAICLRSVDYSDTSQVVTLLTRSGGKIACMAKGSRRPKSRFDGAIEPFSFGPIIFSRPLSEGLCTLSEFEQKPVFAGLRRNLPALNSGLLAAELTESLTELNDPHPELFDELVEFLTHIQSGSDAQAIVAALIDYEIALLTHLGIVPILDRCANCSAAFGPQWKWAYFSSPANGLLCPGCDGAFAEKFRLDIPSARCLMIHDTTPPGKTALKNAHQALLGHFRYLLGRPAKLAGYFQTV